MLKMAGAGNMAERAAASARVRLTGGGMNMHRRVAAARLS